MFRSAPDYFIWIKYISWFYYANEAINIQLWTNVKTITCETGNITSCFTSGSDVLTNNLKMDSVSKSKFKFLRNALNFLSLEFN